MFIALPSKYLSQIDVKVVVFVSLLHNFLIEVASAEKKTKKTNPFCSCSMGRRMSNNVTSNNKAKGRKVPGRTRTQLFTF